MFFKAHSFADVLAHIFIMILIFVVGIAFFFYVYLPITTNHGKTITVPKLTGLSLNQMEEELEKNNLRYQINDSTFMPDVKPYTILSQHPTEGSKVKENRKIYVSVSAVNPPKIKMPSLVDGSFKNAEITLKGFGLVLGHVKTVPSPYQNLVIEQSVNGTPVKAGEYIAKGTKIDLVVGDGSGGVTMPVPDLIGLDIEEAKKLLFEKGLDLGLVEIDNNSDKSSGTITKQTPSAGTIKSGEMVDVWHAP